jgi:Phage integrase family
MFKDLLKKAGLPDIRFHDLRHSVATLLLSLGTHPKVVQELLGHGSISITMDTYSHVVPTMQKNVMARLDGLLGGERQMESEDNGHVAGSRRDRQGATVSLHRTHEQCNNLAILAPGEGHMSQIRDAVFP